jgi:hypothetical protein
LQANLTVNVSPAHLTGLTNYAVNVRYTGPDPSMVEARDALTIATAVRRAARKLLGRGR